MALPFRSRHERQSGDFFLHNAYAVSNRYRVPEGRNRPSYDPTAHRRDYQTGPQSYGFVKTRDPDRRLPKFLASSANASDTRRVTARTSKNGYSAPTPLHVCRLPPNASSRRYRLWAGVHPPPPIGPRLRERTSALRTAPAPPRSNQKDRLKQSGELLHAGTRRLRSLMSHSALRSEDPSSRKRASFSRLMLSRSALCAAHRPHFVKDEPSLFSAMGLPPRAKS